MAKATKQDIFRVKKYRPPGFRSHSSFSFNKWKPAAISCRFASAAEKVAYMRKKKKKKKKKKKRNLPEK